MKNNNNNHQIIFMEVKQEGCEKANFSTYIYDWASFWPTYIIRLWFWQFLLLAIASSKAGFWSCLAVVGWERIWTIFYIIQCHFLNIHRTYSPIPCSWTHQRYRWSGKTRPKITTKSKFTVEINSVKPIWEQKMEHTFFMLGVVNGFSLYD